MCSGADRAGVLNSYFKTFYNTENISTFPQVRQVTSDSFCKLVLTVAEVEAALKETINAKPTGYDGIPAVILKLCAKQLAMPLCAIFNRCLEEGIFPDAWKYANVTPVYKSGDECFVSSYRPISLLSLIAMVFERL